MGPSIVGEGVELLIHIFIFVAAVAALCVPFWVYRIRNEVIEMNRYLKTLVNQNQRVLSEKRILADN